MSSINYKKGGGAEMKHERYIINEEEIELLDRYEGTMAQDKDPYRYDTFPAETLQRKRGFRRRHSTSG